MHKPRRHTHRQPRPLLNYIPGLFSSDNCVIIIHERMFASVKFSAALPGPCRGAEEEEGEEEDDKEDEEEAMKKQKRKRKNNE